MTSSSCGPRRGRPRPCPAAADGAAAAAAATAAAVSTVRRVAGLLFVTRDPQSVAAVCGGSRHVTNYCGRSGFVPGIRRRGPPAGGRIIGPTGDGGTWASRPPPRHLRGPGSQAAFASGVPLCEQERGWWPKASSTAGRRRAYSARRLSRGRRGRGGDGKGGARAGRGAFTRPAGLGRGRCADHGCPMPAAHLTGPSRASEQAARTRIG